MDRWFAVEITPGGRAFGIWIDFIPKRNFAYSVKLADSDHRTLDQMIRDYKGGSRHG